VLLIRHGEKPDSGPDLSDQGWERAKALPELFNRPEFMQYGKPAALYAMSPSDRDPEDTSGSNRAVQTLKYVSQDLGLPINSDYTKTEVPAMVKQIMDDPKLDGKFVVICWEHKVLTNIAEAFGVVPAPKYPGSAFDRAWLLTLKPGGGAPGFQNLPEKLLPGDDDN
jgi:hypothetical protein